MDQDTIELYLRGRLSEQDRIRFELELKNDPKLRDHVHLQRLAFIGLEKLVADDLKVKFIQWESEINNKAISKQLDKGLFRKVRFWYWSVPILLIVILLLSFLYYHRSNENIRHSEDRLIYERDSIILELKNEIKARQRDNPAINNRYDSKPDSILQSEIEHLQHEINRLKSQPSEKSDQYKSENVQMALAAGIDESTLMRGMKDNRNPDPVISAALSYYEQKKYREAVHHLKQIDLNNKDGQRIATFLLPYALFYDKQFGEATYAFENLVEIDRSEIQKIEWYLLLCYIAEDRKSHITNQLVAIVNNPQHRYYTNGIRIEKELKNKKILRD